MRDRPTGSGRTAVVAMMLTGALAVTACGDDDSGAGGESAAPQKLGVEVTEQGNDKFSLNAPTSVRAGLVEISLRTPAGKATHDAQLIRVEGNHSADEVVKAVAAGEGAPMPRWLVPAGGVGQTEAGATGRATQRLSPGKYYILDTGEPEGDNVKAYFETGAVAALDVTGEASAGNLPETDAKITAKDYTFTARGLEAGTNRVTFENAGKEPHHLLAFRYRKGATLPDVKRDFMRYLHPPVGTPTLEPGTRQVAELDLRGGKYALVCFVSDRKGGRPHMAKGMIVEASVE